MAGFNYQNYVNIFTGVSDKYKFANPESAAKANPSDPKAARTNYRSGLLNMAKGRITVFDKSADGKYSLDEYKNEQNSIAKAIFDACDTSVMSAQEKEEFEQLKSADNSQTQAKDFKTLDINSDGFIDSKEIANELSLADQLDGDQNGELKATGFDKLWASKNTQEALKNNYSAMNLDKLGEAND